jgi:hypothetical protein
MRADFVAGFGEAANLPPTGHNFEQETGIGTNIPFLRNE